MRILILGVTGMLGYSLYSNLSDNNKFEVYGTARDISTKECLFLKYKNKLITGVDVYNLNLIKECVNNIKPNVVINCIGIIKQHNKCGKYIDAIKINALFPHELANICNQHNSKLIHFSTDCVFSGTKGSYLENDKADADDLYGKSKYLGEVNYGEHLTLRTSIIGHELSSSISLVDWFLSQKNQVKGFHKAIFSGLPTVYISELLSKLISQNIGLKGLYHLSSEPIDKYSLLCLLNKIYNKKIQIISSDDVIIDRSLNSDKLSKELQLKVPSWSELIHSMYRDYLKRYTK